MDEHRKTFKPIVDDERTLVDMAFNKKRADDRKEWLKNFQVESRYLLLAPT